jgi:hypothetical protein
VVACTPQVKHLQYKFRRILQIGSKKYGTLTACLCESGQDSDVAPTILGQPDVAESGIFPANIPQQFRAAIGGMIVDQDDLRDERSQSFREPAQTLHQRRECGLLVEHWNYDTEFGTAHEVHANSLPV